LAHQQKLLQQQQQQQQQWTGSLKPRRDLAKSGSTGCSKGSRVQAHQQ
jgi:hypothetical protein